MEKDKIDMKQKILSTSEKLFAQQGFDGVSMDEIAKEAQINKSIIYYYFTNKEDLLVSIIRQHLEKFETMFGTISMGEAKTISDIIQEIITLAIDYTSRNGNILKILFRETLMASPKTKIDIVDFIEPLWTKFQSNLKKSFPRVRNMTQLDKLICINLIVDFILILERSTYKTEAALRSLKHNYIERVADIVALLIEKQSSPGPKKGDKR